MTENVVPIHMTLAEMLWPLRAFQSAPWNMQLLLKWMDFLEALFSVYKAKYCGTLYHIHPAYYIHIVQYNHWKKNRRKIEED